MYKGEAITVFGNGLTGGGQEKVSVGCLKAPKPSLHIVNTTKDLFTGSIKLEHCMSGFGRIDVRLLKSGTGT